MSSSPAGDQVLRASAEDVGDRLDVALARWLDEPRSRAAARIERGEVTVDGRPARRSVRLTGDEVVAVASPPAASSGAAGTTPPPIRWEDEHLLVVAKPAGSVVHPGVGNETGTMVQALSEAGVPLAPAGGPERPGIVHRLDRGTSGLLVVAKTDAAYHGLVAALRERRVSRRYAALVAGRMPAAAGRIEGPIGRHPRDRRRFAVVAEGKPAATTWEVRATGRVRAGAAAAPPLDLLRCHLETGRTHQIRVHLASAGHPVVGDVTYGGGSDLAARLGLTRPFLHAQRLSFPHPVTGARVTVEEPLTDDLRRALARLDLDPHTASGVPSDGAPGDDGGGQPPA